MLSVSRWMVSVLPLIAALRPLGAQTSATATWESVASILRTTTTVTDGYQRYNLPRRDITLHVGDLTVSPSPRARHVGGVWRNATGGDNVG
jgi:hypothetical protein